MVFLWDSEELMTQNMVLKLLEPEGLKLEGLMAHSEKLMVHLEWEGTKNDDDDDDRGTTDDDNNDDGADIR